MDIQFKVLRDITDTPVMLDGKLNKITIPAGAICTQTERKINRMGGETSVVYCKIDNINFPLRWLDEEDGESPYIKQIESSGGRRRRTFRRTKRRRTIKRKNKKRKTHRA